jgi:hypothetical protein
MTNLPYHPFEPDHEGGPVYPDRLPGESTHELIVRIRKMRDDHEAGKSPQQRQREHKEAQACEAAMDAALVPLTVVEILGNLAHATACLEDVNEAGGPTPEHAAQMDEIRAALASFVSEWTIAEWTVGSEAP